MHGSSQQTGAYIPWLHLPTSFLSSRKAYQPNSQVIPSPAVDSRAHLKSIRKANNLWNGIVEDYVSTRVWVTSKTYMSRFDSIEFRRDKLLDDSLVYGHASSLSACEKEGSESIYPPIHGQNSCLIPSASIVQSRLKLNQEIKWTCVFSEKIPAPILGNVKLVANSNRQF